MKHKVVGWLLNSCAKLVGATSSDGFLIIFDIDRPVARSVVWGFECQRHSNGGVEGYDGGKVWGGDISVVIGSGKKAVSTREKFLYFLLQNGAF